MSRTYVAYLRRWALSLVIVTIAYVVVNAVVQGRRIRTEEAAPIGEYTAPQAIRRAESLIRSLTEIEPGMRFTADPQVSAPGAPHQDVRWVVRCIDTDGSERAVVSFDASTSRLRGASRRIRQHEFHGNVARHLAKSSADSERVAKRRAVAWLASLGPNEGTSHWAPRSFDSTAYFWLIKLENNGRKAMVKMDRHDGRIVSASLGP